MSPSLYQESKSIPGVQVNTMIPSICHKSKSVDYNLSQSLGTSPGSESCIGWRSINISIYTCSRDKSLHSWNREWILLEVNIYPILDTQFSFSFGLMSVMLRLPTLDSEMVCTGEDMFIISVTSMLVKNFKEW